MKKQDVITHFGGVKEAAKALDLWPATIYAWKEDVPETMSYKIQVITNGKLKVNGDDRHDK